MLKEKNIITGFDVEAIRRDFPILKRKVNGRSLVYFDSGATSQKPQQVINAIVDYYSNHNSNIHRGVHTLSRESTELYEAAREAVRAHLNARSSSEIIFTRGTTESVNLVAACLAKFYLQQGDEVIVSEMEHHSNILPWQQLKEERGIILKSVHVTPGGELDLEHLYSLFTSRTKVLALTHVSNTLGTINPVKEIICKAKEKNILVLLDGAQAVPHLKVDVKELDCDFYAFSGHKVYAPTGIGVLYGRKEWLEKFPAYQAGGGTIKTVSFDKTEYAESPLKFEAGTPNVEGAIGLKTALDYVNLAGMETLHAHENALLYYATTRLKEIEGLTVYGDINLPTAEAFSKKRAGVVSFNLQGVHPFDTGTILDQMGIAVRTGHHCTQPLMSCYKIAGTVRASLGLYNTMEEIDLLVEGVKKAKKMLS